MKRPSKSVWWLVVAVLLVPIVPWLVLGPKLEPWAAGAVSAGGLARGGVGALGVALLAGDSFLPVPSTLVMSALGVALGTFLGGLAAACGLFLSGAIAYWVCRRWGSRWARRIAGEKGLARVESAMREHGPWLIAATRSVPVVQEASSCLAGVARMPARMYFAVLAVGCVPTGFAYAAIGASVLEHRGWGIALSVAVPLLTWPLVYLWLRAKKPQAAD